MKTKKSWIDNAYIYHILVDRFGGDTTRKNTNQFMGGTLKYISRHLDYIQHMGFNTLWLSPICESKNYHGYHITDFYKVDPHFGTMDDLQELITNVHSRGMRIVSDFVPNHCADTHPFFVEAKTEIHNRYRDWFYFNEDGTYRCFMNFDELPKFNLDQEKVRKYMTDVAKYWCEAGFDGLRIDHAIGPSFNFWKTWMAEMKKHYPNKLFIGEVWCAGLTPDLFSTVHLKHEWRKKKQGRSQEELQKDYVGVLDGVLDFAFRDIVLRHIYKGERLIGNKDLEWEVKRHFSKYPKSFKLILFLDNHDSDRILFHYKGDLTLRDEAIDFCKSQRRPFIIYYGTEANMSNKESIFSGIPYADLAVRECLKIDDKAPKAQRQEKVQQKRH